MISFYAPPPMKAGGDINPARFVKISGDRTLVQCGNNERAFGVSENGINTPPGLGGALYPSASITELAARANDDILVFVPGMYTLLEVGTTWVAGALLTSDANGKGKTASTGNPVNAIALDGRAANEFGLVRLLDGFAAP